MTFSGFESFKEANIVDSAKNERELGLLHGLAEKMLGKPIGESEFEDIYGEEVRSDKRYVENMQALFSKESNKETEEKKKWATVFEAIIHSHIELDDWFGPKAKTIRPSLFDDFKNGVDTIVEFEEENGDEKRKHLALAIDVSYGNSLSSKLDRIKKEIDGGELTTVKYFRSESGYKGKLAKVPRVVIGAEFETVKELGESWAHLARGGGSRKHDLAKHPIQLQILDEIDIQLNVFKKYAESIKMTGAAGIYGEALETMRKIREEKAGLFEEKRSDLGELRRKDKTFLVMEEALEQKFKMKDDDRR